MLHIISNKKILVILSIVSVFFVCSSCRGRSVAVDGVPANSEETSVVSESSLGMGGYDQRLYSFQDIDVDISKDDANSSNEETLFYTVYQVQKGDMIGLIAERFGISQDAIISLNTIRNTRTLQIDDYLKIPTIDGISYAVASGDTVEEIAKKYDISVGSILAVNNVQPESMQPGTLLFLPGAKLDWVTLQEINGDLFKKPLRNRYYVSSPYGWRKSPFSGARSFHGGIDMAASSGTRVYAAMGGTVSKVVFGDRVYGNYIVVSHHSGYKTLYAHLNAVKSGITKGKWVDTNTVIGYVGSTGMSTGPHLHFTVYKYNTSKNPSVLWN